MIVILDPWYIAITNLLPLLRKPFALSLLVRWPAASHHVFNLFEQSVKVKDLTNLWNQKRVASFF